MTPKKKNLFIKVRVTAHEKERIQNKADSCGLSVSDFLRQVPLQYRLRNNETQKALLRHMARISSNLYQVARHANFYKDTVDKAYMLLCLQRIEQDLKEVRQCI